MTVLVRRCRAPGAGATPTWPLAAAAVGIAAVSLAVPAAPGYDPWSWLIWGRELLALELDTREGPAWKPLPVMAAAALTAAGGDAAPWLWLVVARAGTVLAVLLAFRLARRLAGGSPLAGAAAALGVALTSGWVAHGAVGDAEGLLTALLLLAVKRGLDGRLGQAFGLGVAAALLRVEAWPFLAALGTLLWRRAPALRLGVAAGAAAAALLWFVPELLGSGDLLRSAERARAPNPGAPALAERPAFATVATAVGLVPAPLLAGVATLGMAAVGRHRPPAATALVPAAGGLAWITLVALMSEAGFSGERRYLLPGAALLAVSGAAGLGRLVEAAVNAARGGGPRRRARSPALRGRARGGGGPRPPDPSPALRGWTRRGGAVLAAVLLAAWAGMAAVARLGDLRAEGRRLAHGAALARDLRGAIASAGGRARVLACGRPHVGRYRGPLLAWHLRIRKAEVGFRPARPGVVFRSPLAPDAAPTPALPNGGRPPFELLARAGTWEVVGACRARRRGAPLRAAADRGHRIRVP